MDITKLSITELKALAYDELAKIQVGQANLQAINVEIQKRGKLEDTTNEPDSILPEVQ